MFFTGPVPTPLLAACLHFHGFPLRKFPHSILGLLSPVQTQSHITHLTVPLAAQVFVTHQALSPSILKRICPEEASLFPVSLTGYVRY